MNSKRMSMMMKKVVHNNNTNNNKSDNVIRVSPTSSLGGDNNCCYAKSLIENYANFKQSSVPARVMYYEGGDWVDFEKEVVEAVKLGFVAGKAVVEVVVDGVDCLFDFYRMLVVDFVGAFRFVAWIDDCGKFFFPQRFGGCNDVDEIGMIGLSNYKLGKIEIEVRVGGVCKRKREEEEEEKVEVKEEEMNEGSCSNVVKKRRCEQEEQIVVKEEQKQQEQVVSDLDSPRWAGTGMLVEEKDRAFSYIRSLFFNWVGESGGGGGVITGIHKITRNGGLEKARYEVFQGQLKRVEVARGDANLSLAWYVSSGGDEVCSILRHGFGGVNDVGFEERYGVGLYLSPVKSKMTSARLKVDENGECHVILCRVVLGKCEKVEEGSKQLYPSNMDFDTGVDDVNNPNWFVVWQANMNTHVNPECIVSYRPTHPVPGKVVESSVLRWVPNASNTLTAKFFSKLKGVIPSSKVPELKTLCSTYKEGKVAKDMFMRRLRSIVGDEMMRSAIRETCG